MQRSCHKVGSYQLTFDTPVGDEVTVLSNDAVMVGSLKEVASKLNLKNESAKKTEQPVQRSCAGQSLECWKSIQEVYVVRAEGGGRQKEG